MSNNPAQDRYQAKGISEPDFDTIRFNDMPIGEIFYLEENGDPYRKTGDNSAENTRVQTTHEVLSNVDVFVRI